MNFGFDTDELALRDGVARFLAKSCELAVVQEVWDAGGGSPARRLNSELAGLGVIGMLAPEETGGLGLGAVALALVLVETGRRAVPVPLVESAAVAVPLMASAADPGGVLPAIVTGEQVVTVAHRVGGLAPGAMWADLFVVGHASGPRLYRADEVTVEPVDSVDRTRALARVTPHGGGVGLSGTDLSSWGALGSAAQLLGLGREMLSITVEYVKQRQQFGVAIGSFQAVKHHLADVMLHLEMAAPAVFAAAYQLERDGPQSSSAGVAVSLAKALASDAASFAAQMALQCHGAMGYTDDYHLHLWLKRTWALAGAWGSAAWHRDRIGKHLGI